MTPEKCLNALIKRGLSQKRNRQKNKKKRTSMVEYPPKKYGRIPKKFPREAKLKRWWNKSVRGQQEAERKV